MQRTFSAALVAALLVTAPAALADDIGGLPSWAQPATPPPPAAAPPNPGTGHPGDVPAIPIDGGLGLLAAAGAGYAVNRLRKRRTSGQNL